MSYRITIVDYDSDWPALFEEEKARLAAVIGDLAVDIQHIGSTSVPGLASKNIVDLMVGVSSLEEARTCIEPLEMLGYNYRASLTDLIPNRLFFERNAGSGLRYHILIVEHMSEYWERYILLRDYLRAHPQEARRYEEFKRKLAAKHATERHKYSQAKTRFIDAIIARARDDGASG